jgi:hypothetical protein
MLPPLPRCSGWGYASLILPSRLSLPRKGCRVGPHIVVFEVCSAFTRVAACPLALSPIRDTLIEGFSHFVTSMTAPIASGGSEFAGWDLHPLESAALSRRTPISDLRNREGNRRVGWNGTCRLGGRERSKSAIEEPTRVVNEGPPPPRRHVRGRHTIRGGCRRPGSCFSIQPAGGSLPPVNGGACSNKLTGTKLFPIKLC